MGLTMIPTMILMLACGVDPSPEQVKLLSTFRNEFISVTPGRDGFPKSFVMGRMEGGGDNERPSHKVTFQYDFHVAKYEIPQNLWEAVMGNNPSKWTGPRNSVEMFSFDKAQEFCRRTTELMQAANLIATNQVIRIPSESEWEYTTRAGTKKIYSFGDDPRELDKYGWSTHNAAGNDPPVGAKAPNPWGLYDVHGYLWEWCADAAHDNYDRAPEDGSAWMKDTTRPDQRVLRGGSWKDKAEELTSSYRRMVSKDVYDDAVGLRCVLALAKDQP